MIHKKRHFLLKCSGWESRGGFCAVFDGGVNSWDACGAGEGGGLMEVSRRNLPSGDS